MNRKYKQDHYAAVMLPLVQTREVPQKVYNESTQAEIDVCLNCTRSKCNGGEWCMKNRAKMNLQPKFRRWTKEENDYILKNYDKMSYQDLALAISRTPKAVGVQLNKLLKEVSQ